MKGYEVKFNIYANSQEEADMATQAIKAFISEHAKQGRAVTATKVANAIGNWKNNVLVRNRIINYFNG